MLEEVAGGSTTPEKRRLETTEDDSGGAKGRQSVIDEAMESSNMKFSPTKAGRSPTEVGPSPKNEKSNVTTEKRHMKVKVFQVLWDRINTTTELVTDIYIDRERGSDALIDNGIDKGRDLDRDKDNHRQNSNKGTQTFMVSGQ